MCEFHNVKFKVSQVSLLKTQGAMMQSKTRCCEQAAGNQSKYFYHLERRNYSAKHIAELELLDKTILNKPKDILNEEY